MRKKRASKQTLPCKRRTSRFRPMRSCTGRLSKNVKPSARKRGCRLVKAIQERSKTWAWINGFGATPKKKARQKRQTGNQKPMQAGWEKKKRGTPLREAFIKKTLPYFNKRRSRPKQASTRF